MVARVTLEMWCGIFIISVTWTRLSSLWKSSSLEYVPLDRIRRIAQWLEHLAQDVQVQDVINIQVLVMLGAHCENELLVMLGARCENELLVMLGAHCENELLVILGAHCENELLT